VKSEISQKRVDALKKTPGVRKHMNSVARDVHKTATTLAPKRTGHYVSGLAVERRQTRGAEDSVFVVANDFKSHWIEWGAAPSPQVHRFRPFPARHVLERATRRHVKKFIPAPKGAR
jgi:hypothetical protein